MASKELLKFNYSTAVARFFVPPRRHITDLSMLVCRQLEGDEAPCSFVVENQLRLDRGF